MPSVTPINPLATTVTSPVVDLPPVRAGQVLEGKFRVERIIGEGGMGLVVEATHLTLDKRVALKFLRREALARPDIVARFAREARAAAKIKSDHVARVFDVGSTEDETPFIVMEYLEGYDLEQILETQGYLEISEAATHVIEACEGLAAAHMHGIVHRDIKPANIFIAESTGGRQVKLLDFGISKAGITTFDTDISSANTTQIMGSPNYMSPDQIRSTKDVDSRADIWSLGVVLFELLTGETPFTATEVTGIIAQVLHEPHRPIRALRPELPIELERVVDKCLSKDPALRYQTGAELAIALLPFAPKSARAVAEKASAIVRTGSNNFEASPDSLPPPLRAPRTSSNHANHGVGPSGTLMLGLPQVSPPRPNHTPFATAPPSSRPTPKQTNGVMIYVALAAVVVGLSGGVFAIVARLRPPPAAVVVVADAPVAPPIAEPLPPIPPASASVATTASMPPTPTPTPTPTPDDEAPTGVGPLPTAAAQPIPMVAATAAAPPQPQPAAASPPSATPSQAPRSRARNAESDIRYER